MDKQIEDTLARRLKEVIQMWREALDLTPGSGFVTLEGVREFSHTLLSSVYLMLLLYRF